MIEGDRAVLALSGSLDVTNADRLGTMLRRLIADECAEIVIDASGLTEIDAAGVGILRGAATSMGARAGHLRFTGAPDAIEATLATAGLLDPPAGSRAARPGCSVRRATEPGERARRPRALPTP